MSQIADAQAHLCEPATASHVSVSVARPAAPAPIVLLRIPVASAHYSYAQLILNGYRHAAACEQLQLNTRTVHRWRQDLMKAGREYFGRVVTYEACAREALQSQKSQEELRQLFYAPL